MFSLRLNLFYRYTYAQL